MAGERCTVVAERVVIKTGRGKQTGVKGNTKMRESWISVMRGDPPPMKPELRSFNRCSTRSPGDCPL